MNNMRAIRKQKELTMKELGKMVGMSESTISLYETGKHDPDLTTLQRIADALSVSVDDLLGREKQDAASDREDAAALMADLTPEEQAQVRQYAEFLKSQRKSD